METLRSAIIEIRQHVLRSVLTLTGIVLGSLALVVMASVMDGVTGAVRQGFEDLGFDGVFAISPKEPATRVERLRFAQSPGLRTEDLGALRERGREILGLTGRAQESAIVQANGTALVVRVFGVEPDYAWIRDRVPAEGRFFTEGDDLAGGRVAVIGSRLRERLFGKGDAIGQEISLGDLRLEVIGVGRELGNSWFQESEFEDEMEGITMPLGTLLRELRGGGSMDAALVRARDPEQLDATQAEVLRILATEHGGVKDVEVENLAAEVLRGRAQADEQVGNWRIVMLAVAAVTLVVGGVGLLSVLLISLAERTYEIGLRKALGATGTSVFALFLVESMLLASLGAGLGIALGIAVTKLAARGFPDGLPVSQGGVLTALASALLVGLLFGLGPAWRAGRLEPVECLRERG